ncbi:hypothetical protein Ocin01_06485 [Orchesella cincta]|uniref:E3 ubiquitin-protein ligase n=1 Tax=Orchesella cincta TaxID=48709 RepID=A0A1D2N556_ORCCI|nr:hypothetical protein Ocin01_06485 [Orchesella cincta]
MYILKKNAADLAAEPEQLTITPTYAYAEVMQYLQLKTKDNGRTDILCLIETSVIYVRIRCKDLTGGVLRWKLPHTVRFGFNYTVLVEEAEMAGVPDENTTTGGKDADESSADAGAAGCSQDSNGGLECPICLQPCMHPVELPCHHVFCFLCIKGVAMQGPQSRCAICRAQIPYSVLTNPHLKDVSQLTKEPKVANGYQWYYESRSGGWWQYDERTMQDLEKAFSNKLLTCQLLLAGHIYVVDFTQMIQYRSNNRNVSRRIKRGINLEKRGVAGIRISGNNSGDGSNGGANNDSSPPPPPSSTGPSSGRRRRGNFSAPGNAQAANTPGNVQTSGVTSVQSNPAHPNLGNPSDPSSQDVLVSDSDDESVDEDEDYDSDYSEGVDADDDMELGEEEEALIGDDSEDTEDDDEYDTRDGARAPTSRSDRSNSSNNQTPPPPAGAGPANVRIPTVVEAVVQKVVEVVVVEEDPIMETVAQPAAQPPWITSQLLHPPSHLQVPMCNLEDVAKVSNNNNIYIDSQIIGQYSHSVTLRPQYEIWKFTGFRWQYSTYFLKYFEVSYSVKVMITYDVRFCFEAGGSLDGHIHSSAPVSTPNYAFFINFFSILLKMAQVQEQDPKKVRSTKRVQEQENSEEKEKEKKQDGCDVNAEIPPGIDNPLPEYGELSKQRHIKKANESVSGGEDPQQKKREACREKPIKKGCIPKDIILPFSEDKPDTLGRFLETDSQTAIGAGNLMKGVRVRKDKVEFPGWCIELTDPQLQSVQDAKEILSSGKPLCDMLDELIEAIGGLGSGITDTDVIETLRRIPHTSKGWSFSHFMFIAGDPKFAKKKGVLQDPLPVQFTECLEQSGDSDKKSKKKNVVDRLYQLPQTAPPDPWPPADAKKEEKDESGFSQRAKLFYSGLLYCDMYDTMQALEKVYLKGESVPEPRESALKRQQESGFGASDMGTRKLGFAEWDRPLPPLPKVSPYLADLPLVGKRRKILKPNGDVGMYRRSQTSLHPIFLAVKAPREAKATIKILEDGQRVKSILSLMASQGGNCLALLPDIGKILHMSDTLLHNQEVVTVQKGPKAPKIYKGNDMIWILKEGKNLFRPHGLPPQIAKIPPLIAFSDGLKLREICKQVRDQHWSYICLRKNQFRESVWQLMHVERIPCGNLRESFAYSFQTYLPPKSVFPIIREDALPW